MYEKPERIEVYTIFIISLNPIYHNRHSTKKSKYPRKALVMVILRISVHEKQDVQILFYVLTTKCFRRDWNVLLRISDRP